MTKNQYLFEAAEKLGNEGVLKTSQDAARFMGQFRRLPYDHVETLSNCVRYNLDWLYGFCHDSFPGLNYYLRSYYLNLAKLIKENRPDLATCKPWNGSEA